MKEITDNNFSKVISEGNVLVDIWADWCRPCLGMAQILDGIEPNNENINFYKLDFDTNPKTPQDFNVKGIPTLLLFKDGELKDTVIGSKNGFDLQNLLNKIYA